MPQTQPRPRAAVRKPSAPLDIYSYTSPERPAKAGAGFVVRAKGNTAEIDLYDEIGYFGVTAKSFREALAGITADRITLNINSPGGDVFDGLAMRNDLLAHKAYVVVRVTGLAASAASVVAMAGDEVLVSDGAFLMIHNAWSVAIGDKRALTERAKLLGKIDASLAEIYSTKTGIDADEIAELMDDETWFSAQEAVDRGFADSVTDADAKASASFDLRQFRNAPSAIAAQAKPNPEDKPATLASTGAEYLMEALAKLQKAMET